MAARSGNGGVVPPLTRIIAGSSDEAANGTLYLRVRRLANQDHLVAIANRVIGGRVYVLLTAAPSVN